VQSSTEFEAVFVQ